MIDKDPSSYEWVTYAWVLGISLWSGLVSFIQKVRRGDASPHNLMEFIGELATSGFVGVVTFWLCEAAGFPPLITAAAIGVCGHMGARMIYILEKIAERAVKRYADPS